MDDLISVIVPVYNVERYLPQCLDSVMNQTYRNVEIILVDDGSTDRSGGICDEYQRKDRRIAVIHKENGGLSDARNAGLNAARGRYFFFLDSDDFIAPHCIETLYRLMKETNSDISIGNFQQTHDGESPKAFERPGRMYAFTKMEALEQLTGTFYLQFTVAWGKLIKREMMSGIRFPVGRLHEDEFTSYKVLYNAKKVVFTEERLLFYRIRPDSITNRNLSVKQMMDWVDAFQERAVFLKSLQLTSSYEKMFRPIFVKMIEIRKAAEEQGNQDVVKEMDLRLAAIRSDINTLPAKHRIYHNLYYLSPDLWEIMDRLYIRSKSFVRTISGKVMPGW